jgi:phosphate/sulfate permease
LSIPPVPASPSTTQTNVLAVGALVSGIVAWIAVPFAAGLVAVVLGHLARGQIRRSGEDGDAMAIGGLVLGYANIVMSIVSVIVFILVFAGMIWFTNAVTPEYPVSTSPEPVPSGYWPEPVPTG